LAGTAKEDKMKVVIRGCRQTWQGAYTSADGRRINSSRTGNHWDEVIEGNKGDRFTLVDISNSGKHRCQRLEIIGNDKTKVIRQSNGQPCFCEAVF
jgi:hypothetical protein